MKWSFASVGVVVAGIIGIVIILLFQQITTNNESDYYLLKEITESAMVESIDVTHYRETGELKIVREKFVENFIRRFSESTNLTGSGYTINFYDIMETPPKASILINTGLGQYRIFEDTSDYNVQNRLDAILEYTDSNTSKTVSQAENPYEEKIYKKDYYYLINGKDETDLYLNVPDVLISPKIKNIEINKANFKALNKVDKNKIYQAIIRQDIDFDFNKNPSSKTDLDEFIMHDINNGDIVTIDKLHRFNLDANKQMIKIDRWDENDNEKNKKYNSHAIINFEVEWSYKEYKYS